MDKKVERLKAILKKGYTERPTFGTDPKDPWSTRYNVNESATLDQYLKSRGINPQFVSKDVKVSHSKSLAFLAWQKAHQNEEVQLETIAMTHTPAEKKAHQMKRAVHYGTEIRTDGGLHGKKLHSEEVEDTITFDIPLLIRMLEYAREDAKTDMDLHKVVKKLIGIRDKGTLTMDDYAFVTKIKEEFELTEQDCKCKDKKEWEKVAQARSEAWRRKQLKVAEDKDPCWSGYTMVGMKKKGGRSVPNCVPAKGVTKAKGFKEETMSEDKYQDSYAATQTVGSEVDTDSKPKRTKELSKSARIIKSIYKKKGVTEDLYDHEKENKSVAGPGKKPKLSTSIKASFGDSAPQAAAVLTGGKTLTGEKRDTIEIDPMMRKPKPAKQ